MKIYPSKKSFFAPNSERWVTDALQMAAQRQGWPTGVVVHSDRSSQAEFSEASIAPQVGNEKDGEMTSRPRPVVTRATYPSASCSSAEPACVSVDNQPIQQADTENNKKEYLTNR